MLRYKLNIGCVNQCVDRVRKLGVQTRGLIGAETERSLDRYSAEEYILGVSVGAH